MFWGLSAAAEHDLDVHAIGHLEAEEQAIVTLFYEEEKSLHDLASITGLTESNLKVKLHRIRKKLGLASDVKIPLYLQKFL